MRQLEYFKSVYETTYRDLLRYVVIQTRNAGDVEDIVQNAYMKFYRRIQRRGHHDICDTKAFLMSIVQKELKSYYRFRLTKAERELPLPDDNVLSEAMPLEEVAATEDTLCQVWHIIESAPILSYKAFVLHWYFGMRVPEIATALGLSESSVTSRLFRVRATIRKKLEKEITP